MFSGIVTRSAAALAVLLGLGMLPAGATPSASNPLDDHGRWPILRGRVEGAYSAWRDASGTDKTQLAKIALQPRMFWVTNGSESASAIEATVRTKIKEYHSDTGSALDNPNGYAQLAVFGLYPRGESRRKEPLTNAMQAHYRAWVDGVARGIGNSRAIVVLEPDLPVALTGWRPNVRFALVAYASRVLSRLPNVVLYLDGGAADWLSVEKQIPVLIRSGVRNVHGIALGNTHYDATSDDILYGATLVRRLAARGYPGKKIVVDTADNGRPFTSRQFHTRFPRGDYTNPNVCRSKTETRCQMLGIPPTTATASSRWGMNLKARNTAATYVDAFLWVGRPWMYRNAAPFLRDRALQLARTTRWQ